MQNVDFLDGVSDLLEAEDRAIPGVLDEIARVRRRKTTPDWRQALSLIIEREIVPRLMLTQQSCLAASDASAPDLPADTCEFTKCLLAADGGEAQSFLASLERQGFAPDRILLEFFAPAARQLGELWTFDECDFIQVSVGLHRLQSFMDEIWNRAYGDFDSHRNSPTVLLMPAPGETHEFGVAMVGNFFRADGWQVIASSPASFLQQIHARSVNIVGVSLSCTRHLDKLQDMLSKARRVSRNASVKIILGGPVFIDRPGLAIELGADGTAADAQGAVQLAKSLLQAPEHL